jgi:hypothetical protein
LTPVDTLGAAAATVLSWRRRSSRASLPSSFRSDLVSDFLTCCSAATWVKALVSGSSAPFAWAAVAAIPMMSTPAATTVVVRRILFRPAGFI